MIKTSIQWATPLSLAIVCTAAGSVALVYLLLRLAAGRPIAPARRWGLWALRGLILAVLVLILLNPVRVEETPGTVERPKVVYLVDTSQSMALGEPSKTRWDRVIATIREADEERKSDVGPQISSFRFGSSLAAIDAPSWRVADPSPTPKPAPGTAQAANPPTAPVLIPSPTDADTLLTGSLETLASRFGQVPPQAVVVFSDGRARDPGGAEAVARGYQRMKVPIHVVPVGEEAVGGDVAIVSVVAPNQVRKSSQVAVQLFVRSYGYKGRRTEVKLATVGADGQPGSILARTPVLLQDGLSSYTLSFPSGEEDRKITAIIDAQPGEVSRDNNTFTVDMAIDHTKIRVLYVEGATDRYVVSRGLFGLGGNEARGAYSSLQLALMEDPDVECTAVMPAGASGDFSLLTRADERSRGLPETASELFAYDAIILSNVPREALSDQHLAWIDDWIARRGGGLCMVGGPNSFGSGQWADTPVGKMLPLEIPANRRDWEDGPTTIKPVVESRIHPIWHIAADESENRSLLKTLPTFLGRNKLGREKPNAEVLAWNGSGTSPVATTPTIAVQPFGRGRTMAMNVPITRRWASDFTQTWGGNDARYYKKFWRNTIYWLTENSSIGRRRLLAQTDKRLYRPGEPIMLLARAFDENASTTLDYRVAVSVEPKSAAEGNSDNSPLRRPSGVARPAESQGPFIPWGEEFDLAKLTGDKTYNASLPIADTKSLPTGVGSSQALRIELTAYEGNTQVDSTALDVQILDDPSEQQNPIPDHDLLKQIADTSGGKVLGGPKALASMLEKLPISVGPPEVKAMPAWSRWWLLSLLISLLTVEWIWRRRLGLA